MSKKDNKVLDENKDEELPISVNYNPNKKKSNKSKLAISCFVLLLAVGVLGNWYWENSDISSKVNTISSNTEKILGEATYVDATTESTTENSYFSSARLDRQSARDQAIEKLQSVVDSQNNDADAKKNATDEIAKISATIENENKIETLVMAKGINNCLAVINDSTGKVDIIVDCEELSDEIIVQIKDIAINQLSCSFEDVTIIQSNSK